MKAAIYNVFETALGPYCLAGCCESDLAFATFSSISWTTIRRRTGFCPPWTGSCRPLWMWSNGTTAFGSLWPQSHCQRASESPQGRIKAYHTLQQRFAIDNMPRTQVIPPITGKELSPVSASSPKLEKQYYQFVLSRDLDMAKLTLRELTARDLSSPGITFELAKLRFMNHVESLLNIVGLSASEVQYLYLRPLDTDQAIYQLIEELFADIAEQRISSEQARQVKIERCAITSSKTTRTAISVLP